jgi:hypothetical protein
LVQLAYPLVESRYELVPDEDDQWTPSVDVA